MKLSKLKWKNIAVTALLCAGIILYSCGNDNKSGTNSTTSTTDTATSVEGTTTTSNDTGTLNSRNTSTAAKRKGKISVAITPANNTGKMVADNTGYYNYTEVAPVFKGGQGAIEDYITNNIQYPEEAIENNIEGTVNVEFGIDESGNISGIKTLGTKLGYGLEEEAIKVISGMPAWTPGTVKGKNVKTRMILPITFRLEE